MRSWGDLDRLVARVRHPRAALLPLDPVDLPAAVRARAGLPQGGGGQLVSRRTRPCSPTSRSSTAAASAAARRSRCASSSSGSSASPTTPTACSTTSTTIEWPPHVKTMQRNWIGRSEGAEVTFTLPELGVDYPVFTTRPDTLFGATFFVMAPEHPTSCAWPPGTEHEQAVREYVNRALAESREERARHRAHEDRRPARPHGDQPGQRRADPDVRRRLRADGVRHRRDHGRARARPARLRLRDDVRPADPAGRRARGRRPDDDGPFVAHTDDEVLVNSGQLHRHDRRRGARTRSSTGSTSEGRGHRSINYRLRDWLLSRQRYWGARSRSSTATRAGWCRCPRTSCRCVLPDVEDYTPQGPLAAGGRRGLGATRRARRAAARRAARPTRWTRSSTRRGTSCATRDADNDEAAWDPGGHQPLDAGRPVHRRHRARDPAPAVRALLREGARRHGAAGRRRSRSSACSRRA